MPFLESPLEWLAEGIEPSTEKKSQGFQVDESPAPSHFDYMFNKTSKSIKELQQKAGEVKTVNNQLPDSNGNVNVAVDTTNLATKQSVTDVSNALTSHQTDDTKHLINGLLKINNGSTNFLLKMDVDGLYLEEV